MGFLEVIELIASAMIIILAICIIVLFHEIIKRINTEEMQEEEQLESKKEYESPFIEFAFERENHLSKENNHEET